METSAKKRFFLEGKIGPNRWVSVGTVSANLQAYETGFCALQEAKHAKGRVKDYLRVKEPRNKVPIRIVELADAS